MDALIRVLFLCTGNSCRSQMAEGWARFLKGDCLEVYSCGIETHGLNRYAVQVMAESGVDISLHLSKSIDAYSHIDFDFVVTVCGHANENCPVFPGKTKIVHVGFQDPPQLAQEVKKQGGDNNAQLDCYRKVRDQIKAFVETLPDSLHG
ncbi:MAG: arsenate reductase ArsC [Deltaproteobacteria bacterium]|nr:arsenate reductase ArsC [Deltaproteobacteria bacterium]